MAGLLPTRLVHTRKVPFGVSTGIIFTPPLSTSSRPVLSRYSTATVRPETESFEQPNKTSTLTTSNRVGFKINLLCELG